LEDPERRAIIWTEGPLRDTHAAAFFTHDMILQFADHFPDCAQVLATVTKAEPTWADLDPQGKDVLLGRYIDYLLKVRHTQQVVVDSNALILTREDDTSSSLEPFKSLHRYIDALSAFEDMTAKRLENRRIDARLTANLLGDPNVERMTVVSGDGPIPVVA